MISPAAWLAVWAVQKYRASRPDHLKGSCIYTPTCGDYADVAVRRYGILVGGWLTVRRLLRCNRIRFEGGDDPVPPLSWFPTLRTRQANWRESENHGRRI